ncbi:hypothetical protein K2X05_14200 [bacterium]|nr:hypothetical protein [bacterium]
MGAKPMKLITVPTNGQISIGTKWAGRQICIEELSETELHISAGTFVAESQKTFFTTKSQATLKEFDKWEKSAHTSQSALDTLKQIKKHRNSRGK